MLTIYMQDNAIGDWYEFLREFSSNRSLKKLNLKVEHPTYSYASTSFLMPPKGTNINARVLLEVTANSQIEDLQISV